MKVEEEARLNPTFHDLIITDFAKGIDFDAAPTGSSFKLSPNRGAQGPNQIEYLTQHFAQTLISQQH
jgi:hypothetical protein